jgi:thymidylate synthase
VSSHPKHIKEENLSIAWAKAFLSTMKHPEISPMTITITGLSNEIIPECSEIRSDLDGFLRDNSARSCHTVANTIFPIRLWNRNKERDVLYKRYLRSRSQIHRDKANLNGVYFERLIAYGEGTNDEGTNQLEYIIQTYMKGNHRRSALQASIYDPTCDATDQRQRGFPCLQQVGFSRIDGSGLCVTGYYPKEYIFDRGYGNYLGLCRLGQFMATQMRLELAQMICFVGVAAVGKMRKTPLRGMERRIERNVTEYETRMRGQNE